MFVIDAVAVAATEEEEDEDEMKIFDGFGFGGVFSKTESISILDYYLGFTPKGVFPWGKKSVPDTEFKILRWMWEKPISVLHWER